MPAVLKLPLEQTFGLGLNTEDDPTQDTTVTIRQATQRESERRAELTADATRIYRGGDSKDVEVRQRWSIEEQKRLECYLTLAGCNLTVPDADEKKSPRQLFIFRKENGRNVLAMTEEEFKEVWGQLPDEWTNLIHEKVLKVNATWNPNS